MSTAHTPNYLGGRLDDAHLQRGLHATLDRQSTATDHQDAFAWKRRTPVIPVAHSGRGAGIAVDRPASLAPPTDDRKSTCRQQYQQQRDVTVT